MYHAIMLSCYLAKIKIKSNNKKNNAGYYVLCALIFMFCGVEMQ